MVSANRSNGDLVAVATTSRCGFTIDPGRCQIYMASATQNLQLLAMPQALIGACEMTTHNKDKIIAAAKEVGFAEWENTDSPEFLSLIFEFYAIAFEAGRQAEREECAKVCDKEHVDPHNLPAAIVARRCADAIRARS